MRRAFPAHFLSKQLPKQLDRLFKKHISRPLTAIYHTAISFTEPVPCSEGVKKCDKELNFQPNSQNANISLFSKYDTAFSFNKQYIIILTIVTMMDLGDFFTFKTIFHIKMTIAFNYL